MTRGARLLRSLGPAVARPAPREMLRAGVGAALALVCTGFVARAVHAPGGGADFLIAPLGASAFLMFAVPNSPLAQPWSAIVGNLVAALAAIACVLLIPDRPLAVAAATAAAFGLTMLARAQHPPAAAVALLIALNGPAVAAEGFAFALSPVLLDTVLLVGLAVIWNRATGRRYPFRQPDEPGPHGTRDPAADRRLGLSAVELGEILARMNLAANIGAEDLARVIGAAEAEAAARHLGGMTAGEMMSRDVVTVPADMTLPALAAVFRSRGFKTLPVVDAAGGYLGLVSQVDLLGRTDPLDTAGLLMATGLRTVGTATPVGALLALMADGRQQAVPVVEGGRLLGIVSRTDMIGALAHALRD